MIDTASGIQPSVAASTSSSTAPTLPQDQPGTSHKVKRRRQGDEADQPESSVPTPALNPPPVGNTSVEKRLATWDRYNFVEDAKHIDMSHLLNNPSQGTVVFAPTDNGIAATTTATRATREKLEEHINY